MPTWMTHRREVGIDRGHDCGAGRGGSKMETPGQFRKWLVSNLANIARLWIKINTVTGDGRNYVLGGFRITVWFTHF